MLSTAFWMQDDHRATTEAVGNALDSQPRQRNYCPSLFPAQWPLGRILGTTRRWLISGRFFTYKFGAHPYAGAGGNIELAFGRLGSRIGRDPRPPVPAVGGAPEAVSAARHAPSAPAGTRLGAGAVARCAGRTARPAEKRTLAGQGRGPWLHGNPLRRGGAAARSRKKGGGWAEARAGPAVWR